MKITSVRLKLRNYLQTGGDMHNTLILEVIFTNIPICLLVLVHVLLIQNL